ncbi:trypsin-like peptidase domain-containing protein [Streptomyces sp. NPDC058773]|uniref:trypsin-like peptidase domain-containing protein n=1 Tax=Streptomyces sp. NPDC058773 TaxID=3346632 RepID=UPI0036BCFB93
MDDGKATGPKLKWWSRPGGTPGTQPSTEADPQTEPPVGGPAAGTPPEPSGTSEVQSDGDWLVRPPQRAEAPGATAPSPTAPGPAAAAAASGAATPEVADPAAELTAQLPRVPDTSAGQQPEDWSVRPPRSGDGATPAGAPGDTGTAEAADVVEPTEGAEATGAAETSQAAEAAAGEAELRGRSAMRAAMAAEDPNEKTAGAAVGGPAVGTRSTPATVTLGKVRGDAQGEAAGPATASEAEAPTAAMATAAASAPTDGATTTVTKAATAAAEAATAPTTTAAPLPPTPPASAEGTGAAPRQQPLHAEDPYGTPPYGGPGPWAPAPPVQRPVATPARGTVIPPQAGPLPPYGAPAAPQPAPGRADTPGQAGAPGPAGAQSAAPDSAAGPGAGPDVAPAGPDGPFVPHPGDGGPRPASATAPHATVAHPGAAPQPGAAPHPGTAAQPGTAVVPGTTPHPGTTPPGDHSPTPAAPNTPTAWHQYDPWSAPLQSGPTGPATAPRRRRGPLVAGAVALALLAGGVGGGIGAYVERYGGISDIKLPQAAGDDGGRKPDSVAGIAQAALPGVVTLHVRGSAEQGTGTGFVLDHQGHILTNNHVVQPAGSSGEISVTFSGGQTAKARVVGRDGGYDLAVVQVEGVAGLRPLTLGNSDAVRVGDPVVAIGAPFDLANTVTSGIISAKQRPITAGGQKGDGSDVSYVDALQTDAPINPGNSGGPLVDAKARVIGINSAIRAADGVGGPDGDSQGQGQGGSIGLGFAIPINQAKRVAEELINTGRATHPVIGVTLEMEYAGDGARVGEHGKDGKQPVIPGGPGAKAGIKAGDVITEVDGAPVHSGEELIVKIRSHRPGDTLVLTLQRGGKERSVRLSLGSSSTD